MLPIEAGAKETLDFVLRYLPDGEVRLLEVGCGRGHLAAMLSSHSVSVRGIDVSEESIKEARSLGVDALQIDFLDFEDDPFDVILFSRSLHHIHPLAEAVDKACALLKSDGLLMVEDFGIELADYRTAERRYATESELKKSGHIIGEITEHGSDEDPFLRWRADHYLHHEISTSAAMREALQERFVIKGEERAPYLYRYLLESLATDESGFSTALSVIAMERLLIEQGYIQAIGARWVAVKPLVN